jgi:SAM-dependent methyltransferase
MDARLGSEQVAEAYDCLAPWYDTFTAGYAYEPWMEAIEARAVALGLRGRRALDLACGTGNSTGLLLARGYSVVACDISSAMIAEAQAKFPQHAGRFLVADMRALPALGEFDLVLCLDDATNYLLTDEELDMAFASVAGLLSPTGVFVFDVNSLRTYRTTFAQDTVKSGDTVFMAWRGENSASFRQREIGRATVEIFVKRADGLWERSAMRHVQRHHTVEAVTAALARAGLECVASGQHPGARLEDSVDEEAHIKVVFFARRTPTYAHERR